MKRFWTIVFFLGANLSLVRVGMVFGRDGVAVTKGIAAFLVLTFVWAALDSSRQLDRERVLRSQTFALRARTSEAYSACSCGAYRKDRENHEVTS